jgi:PEP-CTERM motif
MCMLRTISALARGVLFGFLVVCSGSAIAQTVTAENGPHAGWNVIPLSFGAGRYQQVYASSLFSAPVNITSVAFSTDVEYVYSADIALRFTTTSIALGGLSSDLDSNFSIPLTSVLSTASFSQTIAGGSEAFGLTFDFASTPFAFNPASGNLLMDLVIGNQVMSPTDYPAFFAFSTGDGSASVYSRAWNIDAFAQGSDGWGLRTQFGYASVAAVPEPETYAMLLAGLGLLGFVARRRRLKLIA